MLLFFWKEYFLDLHPEQLGNLECQRKAGIIFSCFYRVDCLPRDTQLIGEVSLRPVPLCAQDFQSVLHWYFLMKYPRLMPHIANMIGSTHRVGKGGKPTFSRKPYAKVINPVVMAESVTACSWIF